MTRWELPGYARIRLACDPVLTAMLLEAASLCVTSASSLWGLKNIHGGAHRAHQGLVASGDRFVSTAQESERLRSALRAAGHDVLAVEMEGAAVAQVCHDYGLPFAAVRTISDRADDAAHSDFAQFVQTVASRYAEHMVLSFLQAL